MIKVKAPAKINLGLKIKGKRSDGYHLLDTIYSSINLYDEIKIEKTSAKGISIYSNSKNIPLDNTNLIIKALNAVGINNGLSINLRKRIPVGGGLAGGSTDAAAILRILPDLGIHLSDREIKEAAINLGADVYYCFIGNIQRGKGVGEKLRQIEVADLPKVALLPQNISCDTKKVFNKYSQLKENRFKGDLDLVEKGLIKGDFSLIDKNIDNSLEEAVFLLYPRLKEKVQLLRSHKLNIQISGSGSSLYMVLKNEHDIIKLKNVYEEELIVCNMINNR
ncbi:MAG: 4-(cytidine 5'-diphospho)-2-C-methyl-D-erythritol kinase [Clostridia bacterium]